MANLPFVLSLAVGIPALLALFIAIILRRVVPTNMVHIVQATRSSKPYGRGKPSGNTYYAFPSWVPKFGVTVTAFPESIFQVTLKGYEAYDKARVPFVIDATAFFRIADAEVAAQRVETFEALKNDLFAVLQGAVRKVLADNVLEDIMHSRAGLGNQFTSEVQEQISEWGVLPVKTIEFMDLRDASESQVIANVMAKEQSRIEMESRVAVADNHRAAELAEIGARQVVDVQREIAAQAVGIRTAEKEREVGIAQENTQQEVLAAAKDTAVRNMEVQSVKNVREAEIQRDVAKVRAEQEKDVAVVNAEAQRQVQVVSAEGEKQSVTTRAEGDLAAAKHQADAIRVKGEASADAEKAMLMAPVEAQIKLSEQIGTNPGYLHYLIEVKKVESARDVGLGMSQAMQAADLKVIANAGDMQQGVAKLGDIFTPAGGTQLTGMLTALAQTPEGKQFIDSISPMLGQGATAGALVGAVSGKASAGAIAGSAASAPQAAAGATAVPVPEVIAAPLG